ncbi:SCP2 sterol-binding domain-containing protein [Sulfobacillus harzensis]|uniref:Fis family transcriptional regulator n=1 Tax=Sulfobacillus harzensis TaxID=2729629 RepID=A0A7Y0L8A6_9FIRM|nr:Fis family transcriptional regulator [Sulfobacillus harzensis]NMP24853.1 Fis family transcriptional regulator [Sulfobacillus harzensis]
MAYEVFTNEWAQAWQTELNQSRAYQEAAATWEWPLVLVMEADPDENIPEQRAVYVDLFHGQCREARLATDEDLDQAPYVITADPFTWREVMDGELEAIAGIMRGRLVLTRGNMVVLARYVPAATELVRAAARIDSVFPGAGA